MTEHTPGPWDYEHGTDDQYHIHAPDGLCIASTQNRADKFQAAAQSMEEDEANAALLSAAPDLLAACEEAINLSTNKELIDMLRAAIQKAKGE